MPEHLCRAATKRATDGDCETCHGAYTYALHFSRGEGSAAGHPFLGRVLERCGLPESDSAHHQRHLGIDGEEAVTMGDHAYEDGLRCLACGGTGKVCLDPLYEMYAPCPSPDCISGIVLVEEMVDG